MSDRRRAYISIRPESLLTLLRDLDGEVRFRARGVPEDARAVGVYFDDRQDELRLYIEAESLPPVPENEPWPALTVELTVLPT